MDHCSLHFETDISQQAEQRCMRRGLLKRGDSSDTLKALADGRHGQGSSIHRSTKRIGGVTVRI